MHTKKRALSLLLTLAMVFTLLPTAALAEEPAGAGSTETQGSQSTSHVISAFSALTQTAYEVENGGEAPALPGTVTATVDGTQNTSVAVTWTSEPAFDAAAAGEYTFTAGAEGYTLDETVENLAWPAVTVTVKEATQPTAINDIGLFGDKTAVDTAIAASQTWDGNTKEVSSAVAITGSADSGNPVVITVTGTVEVRAQITTTGYVKFTGGGTLKHAFGAAAAESHNCDMLRVGSSGYMTIDGVNLDGGTGVGAVVCANGGFATLKNLTVQNVTYGSANDGSNKSALHTAGEHSALILENLTIKGAGGGGGTRGVIHNDQAGAGVSMKNVTFENNAGSATICGGKMQLSGALNIQNTAGDMTLGADSEIAGDLTVNSDVPIYVGGTTLIKKALTLSGTGNNVNTFKRANNFNGHLFKLSAGADITLKTITVDGNKENVPDATNNDARALFSMETAGVKLTLDNGAVLQNNDGGTPFGGTSAGAVRIVKGTLTMAVGSAVKDCKSASYGGAVLVGASNSADSEASFIMNGGEISGCAGGTQTGNAVCVWGGAFTMNGGEIKNNSGNCLGAVAIDTVGTITMTGGKISGNTSTAKADPSGSGNTIGGMGGGVYVTGTTGTFTMTGGEISGNTAAKGGGVYVAGGTVNLSKGAISGNVGAAGSSGYAGGGVTVMGGTVTIGDGTGTGTGGADPDVLIQGNNAFDGAGVMIGSSTEGTGTVTINKDAKISGNSGAYGAGVYDAKADAVTIDGAAITGNTATGGGAGLMVYDTTPVTLKGKVTISGNEKLATVDAVLGAAGNSRDNVRLNSATATLKLTANLDPAASVGIHTQLGDGHNNQALVTADSEAIAAASKVCFFDDAGTQGIRQDATTKTNLVWGAEGNSMEDVYVANAAADDAIPNGDDDAEGNAAAPVLTLNEAYRRVKTNGTIHVMNELSAARNLDCNEDKTVTILTDTDGDLTDTETAVAVKRAAGFTDAPVLTVSKGGVTLKNITVDGNKANVTAAASLISVGAGGALTLADKATVQNSSISAHMTGTVMSYGQLTIESGAKVTGNKSYDGGGVLLVNGTLTMTGGEISGNEATGYGGGLYLLPNAAGTGPNHPVANISGGKIQNNFVSSSASTTGGAGIMIHGNSVVNLSGDVAVTGNGLKNATGSLASNGAGIHLYMPTSKLTVAGKVVIDNNTLGATLTGGTLTPGSIQSDVGLKTGATVSLKGALTSGSHIGVYTQKMPTTLGETVDVGVGDRYAVTAADAGVFFSNRPTQAGVKFAGGKVVLSFDARSEKVTVGVDGTNTGKTTVTVSGSKTDTQYSVDGGTTWVTGNGGDLVFDNLEPGTSTTVKSRPLNDSGAGTAMATVTTPTADFADVKGGDVTRGPGTAVSGAAKDKITVKPTSTDQLYAVVNKETGEVSEWKTGVGASTGLEFDGLDPDGTYEVVTKDKDVAVGTGDQNSSQGKGVVSGPRVEKNEVSCGNAADGKGTLTVNPTDPKLDYIVIDPATGKAATGVEWKQGNDGKLTFTGLDNETKYAVATRPHGAEDVTTEGLANAITEGWKVWTPTVPVVAPKEDGGYKNNAVNNSKREFNNTTDDGKDKITIQGENGYSYGVRAKNADGTYTYYKADGAAASGQSDTGVWLSGTGDKVFANLPAGKDYEICKYKDSIKASGGADSTYYYALTKVPTLPQVVGENDITTAIQDNGKASITVNPAKSDYKYVLTDKGGKVLAVKPGNDGSITFPDLVPGAEYHVLTVGKNDPDPSGTLNPDALKRATKVETPAIDLANGSVTAGKDPSNAGKTQIVIQPASEDVQYVVIDKSSSPTTNKVVGVGSTTTPGGKVTIGGLTPNHEYAVVAVPKTPGVSVGDTVDPTTKPGAVDIKTPNTADANVTGKLPTADQITSDSSSITINPTQAGMEYNLVDKNGKPVGTWKPTPAGNGALTFTGLSSSTEYTVVMRPVNAGTTGELPLTGPSKSTTAGGSSSSSGSTGGGSSSGATAEKTENGKIKIDKPNASKGQTVTITVTPDPGYELGKLTVTDKKGNEVEVKDLGNGKYSFVMPADRPVKVAAEFVASAATGDPETNGVSKLLVTDDHIAYLKGDEQGNFRPTGNITRAETAQMFYNLLKDKNVTGSKSFSDVTADAWYAKAVNALAGLDIVQGVGENTYEPDRAITRAEFVAVAMRFATHVTGTKTFTDVGEDYWAHDYITGAAYYGWINGYEDGSFKPTSPITRAEAATVVNNMLNREGDKAFIDKAEDLKLFPDVSKDYWAFLDIVEATNAHDFTRDTDGVESWGK